MSFCTYDLRAMVIFAFEKFSLIHRKAGVAITTSPTQLGERIMMLFLLAGFINEASVELKTKISKFGFDSTVTLYLLSR